MGDPAPRTYSEPPEPDLRRFGRYTLCYRLARGGMASVYLAQLQGDGTFQKWVAIKMIHPRIAADERFVSMFMHEAQILSRLDHPHVCSVFDFGKQGDEHFLAMEYLHGESVAAVLKRANKEDKPVPFAIAARIVSDAARGLHAAHELTIADGRPAGVVHRDVSPQNIFLLYEGTAKVVDFGIARSEERRGEVTRTGEIRGKYHYMAPEQLRQDPIDRRTDVFALGIVLWELTTGSRLFKRRRDVDIMLAVLSGEYPHPSEKRDDYPQALEDIVMKALAPAPERRYQTADELARALNALIAKIGEPADHQDVADYVMALFPDRRRARDELLQKASELQNIVELDSTSESLSIEDQTNIDSAPTAEPRHLAIPPPPMKVTRSSLIFLVPIALAITVLVAYLAWPSAPRAPRPRPEPVPAVVPPPVAPPPVVVAPPVPPPIAPPVAPPSAPPSAQHVRRNIRGRTESAPNGPTHEEHETARGQRENGRSGPRVMTDFERIE